MRVLGSMLLLLIVVACKGGGGSDGVTSGSSTLNGVYQSCEYNSDDDYSMRGTILVNSEIVTEVIRYYSGSGCISGNEVLEDRSVYSYAKISTGYRLAYVGLTSTSLASSDVNYNNSNSYCGYNDWTLNIPKLILDRNCDGTTISEGDYFDLNFKKSGSSLVVVAPGGTFTYASISPWNFANQGQTIADGTWFYFNGNGGAILSTNNGTYTMTYLNSDTMRYFVANGTYASANNVVQTTVTSYSPACGDDVGSTDSEKFVQSNFSLSIQGETANEGVIFEKMPLTSAEIMGALFTGYSAGCF